jgi:hypothetical protein
MGHIVLVIKMTGLLLLVPDGRPDRLPMHVLMPATGDSAPIHIPQIGYKVASPALCPYSYDMREMVCYANISGWSLEIGQGGKPRNRQPPEPWGAADVSLPSHRVNGSRLRDRPGRSVEARVTLYSGAFTGRCNLATWSIGNQNGLVLSNVVTWTDSIPENTLQLVMHRLDRANGEPETQRLVPLYPDSQNRLELFIRNAPASYVEASRTGSAPAPSDHDVTINSTERATHFHAYYDLLSVPYNERNIPAMPTPAISEPCGWPGTLRMPGTLSCMVASGGVSP